MVIVVMIVLRAVVVILVLMGTGRCWPNSHWLHRQRLMQVTLSFTGAPALFDDHMDQSLPSGVRQGALGEGGNRVRGCTWLV